MTSSDTSFAAFLSYSHVDEDTADWLQKRLEAYRAPSSLVGKDGRRGPIRSRLGKVFRDRSELPAAGDLSAELKSSLQRSEALVVLCSPEAARSHYVNEEIRLYKQLRGKEQIFAVIVSGEPHGAKTSGLNLEQDCFPKALLYEMSAAGDISDTPESVEPLAADFRAGKDGRPNGSLKIIAALLGVGLDDLVQRELQAEKSRRRRANAIAAGMSVLALAALTTSGVAVWQRRVARLNADQAQKNAIEARTNEGRAVAARSDAETAGRRAEDEEMLAIGRSLAVTVEGFARDNSRQLEVTAANPAKGSLKAPRELMAALTIEAMRRIPADEASELAAAMALQLWEETVIPGSGDAQDEIIKVPEQNKFAKAGFGTPLKLLNISNGHIQTVMPDEIGESDGSAPILEFGASSPDGHYISLEPSGGKAFIVDTVSLNVRSIPAEMWTTRFSVDSHRLASLVSEENKDVLKIIQLPAYAIQKIDLGDSHNLKINYFSSSFIMLVGPASIIIVNERGAATEYLLPTGLSGVALTSDGKHVFVAVAKRGPASPAPPSVVDELATAKTPTAIDTHGPTKLAVVPPHSGPPQKTVELSGKSSAGLYRLDPSAAKLYPVLELPIEPIGLSISDDKTKLFIHGSDRVCVVDPKERTTPHCEMLHEGTLRYGNVFLKAMSWNKKWLIAQESSGWFFLNLEDYSGWHLAQEEPQTVKTSGRTDFALAIGSRDFALVNTDLRAPLVRLDNLMTDQDQHLEIDDAGTILMFSSPRGVLVSQLKPDVLMAHLCAKPGMNLTREEWKRYIGNSPWQATCASWK